jgi:hypothetical protein
MNDPSFAVDQKLCNNRDTLIILLQTLEVVVKAGSDNLKAVMTRILEWKDYHRNIISCIIYTIK